MLYLSVNVRVYPLNKTGFFQRICGGSSLCLLFLRVFPCHQVFLFVLFPPNVVQLLQVLTYPMELTSSSSLVWNLRTEAIIRTNFQCEFRKSSSSHSSVRWSSTLLLRCSLAGMAFPRLKSQNIHHYLFFLLRNWRVFNASLGWPVVLH